MTNSLFDNNNRAPAPETPVVPEGSSYLDTLVGEGKKYSDAETLAKTVWHATQHIPKIEQENAALRAELEKRANTEEFMNKILERVKTQTPSNEQNNQSSQEQNEQSKTPDVAQLVKELYNQEQQKSKINQNVDKVAAVLQEKWGPGFSDRLKQRAQELNVTPDYLQQTAANYPDLFLEIVLKNDKQVDNTHVPPRGHGQNNHQPTTNRMTFKDYEKMRKTDPKRYWDINTQVKINEDAIALKEDFYK